MDTIQLASEKFREQIKVIIDNLKDSDRENIGTETLVLKPWIERIDQPNLPNNIGITGKVLAENHIHPKILISDQIYQDPDRCRYLGSLWDAKNNKEIINIIGRDKIINLMKEISKTGFHFLF